MALTRRSVSIEPQDLMAMDPNIQVPSTIDKLPNLARPPQYHGGSFNKSYPQVYAGKTGPRVGQPSVNEPNINVGDDSELEKLREVIGQVQDHTNILYHDQEETRGAVSDALAQ
uniref:Uncharacterized protein n=1 Tax=Cannabis sativa TaxID=3483 RepID=A0A803Q9C6_CANSA